MKTAEEIASEYLKSFDRYYLPEQEKELTEAIEQYSKQKAVEFENWLVINGRKYPPEMSCEELYDEFINQK